MIFAAGDLSDPHGTHRTCLDCIFQAIEIVRDDAWFQDSVVWLYRGGKNGNESKWRCRCAGSEK